MAEKKPLNSLDRVMLRDVVPLRTPFSIYIFPTTFCNFKCVYCAHSLSRAEMLDKYNFTPQQMSLATCKKIIAQLSEFSEKIKLISFTGHGEPLLNKDLPMMVRIAKDAHVANRLEIITNASLLTQDLTKALVDAGLDGLRVSLQGVNASQYKDICGRDIDFKKFIDEIAFFYTYSRGKCDLFVKVMDVSLDEGDEDVFYRLFDTISDRMFVETCRPVYDGIAFTDEMRAIVIDRYGNEHPPRDVCPLCFFVLSIFPDGDVEPCDTIYKPIVLGNIYNETLKEMFTGMKLREFQIAHLNKKRKSNPKCAVCVAPDDVSHPLDVLDGYERMILGQIMGGDCSG